MAGLTESAVGAGIALLLGGIAGGLAYVWAVKLTPLPEPASNSPRMGPGLAAGLFSAVLTAGFVLAVLVGNCQQTPSVRPDEFWRYGRIVYHAVLIWLLLAATITDLRDYVIPDQITVSGMLIGIVAATASGDLQMMHLWIDWNQQHPLHGPYIPEWIKAHHHLHGLAWSGAGLFVGAAVTWIVRWTSAVILGRQALGFGDVTLMAMIGSFIGWQPVVCVFLIAPMCGILVAMLTWLFTGRSFVPYGPYLALATVVVLFTWRGIWEPAKWTFGDRQSLVVLGTAAVVTLVVLLGILRFYWSIPVHSARRSEKEPPSAEGHQDSE